MNRSFEGGGGAPSQQKAAGFRVAEGAGLKG